MRKTIVVLAALALVWAALAVWPFIGLYGIVRAAQDNDIPALTKRVNFPSVGRGLIEQVLRAYNQAIGAKVNPNSVVFAIASTIADPIVAKMVSPEALAELLRTGWPQSVIPQQPNRTEGLKVPALTDAWPMFLSSHYGIGRFSIALPPEKPRPEAFVIELQLSDWTWRLTRVDLPEAIVKRVAQELAKASRSN